LITQGRLHPGAGNVQRGLLLFLLGHASVQSWELVSQWLQGRTIASMVASRRTTSANVTSFSESFPEPKPATEVVLMAGNERPGPLNTNM
jgi:hypothetical protein